MGDNKEKTYTQEEILTETDKYKQFYRAGEINFAMNIAKSRDRFKWGLGYLGILSAGTLAKWISSSKFPSAMLLPISAVVYYCFWEYDIGYGNKFNRVNLEAHAILNKEKYKYFGKY
jgi:hypothetical protein